VIYELPRQLAISDGLEVMRATYAYARVHVRRARTPGIDGTSVRHLQALALALVREAEHYRAVFMGGVTLF
jgi:hypothetical protein